MLDNRLITFISLCKTRSYTKTANELFISQPGVTHHIKSLEMDFKCRLFQMENKELKLTQSGELMLSFAQKQMNMYKQFEDLLRSNETDSQSFKMATTESLAKYYVNDIIKEWLRENPNDRMDISTSSGEALFKLLDEGMVDFIVTDYPFDKSIYESSLLKTTSIALVVGPEHQLASKKRVFLKGIMDERWFFNDKHDAVTSIIRHELLIQNIPADSIAHYTRVASDDLIVDLVKCNLGIAFISRDYIAEELINGSLVEINVQDVNLMKEINFVYTKNNLNGQKLAEYYNSFDQLKRKAVYDKYNITQ